MPKMKTRSAAKKRFRVTGTGKLMRRDTMKSHNLEHKSANRKRKFGIPKPLAKADRKRVLRALGKR
jgi:large subunit ribosomal protein L35